MIMTPLSMLLNEERKGYRLGDSGRLVNQLLFMDDLKLYGKSQDEVDALLGLVQEYSNDIGMEFGMDKYAVLGINGPPATLATPGPPATGGGPRAPPP